MVRRRARGKGWMTIARCDPAVKRASNARTTPRRAAQRCLAAQRTAARAPGAAHGSARDPLPRAATSITVAGTQ